MQLQPKLPKHPLLSVSVFSGPLHIQCLTNYSTPVRSTPLSLSPFLYQLPPGQQRRHPTQQLSRQASYPHSSALGLAQPCRKPIVRGVLLLHTSQDRWLHIRCLMRQHSPRVFQVASVQSWSTASKSMRGASPTGLSNGGTTALIKAIGTRCVDPFAWSTLPLISAIRPR